MRTPSLSSRRGVSSADVLVVVSVLSVAASILYPLARRRAFETLVETAIADVEALHGEALRMRDETGTWPESTAPGELSSAMAQNGLSMAREEYTLEWRRWVSAELPSPDTSAVPIPDDEDNPRPEIPLPPPLVLTTGGITVHSGDDALLAELLNNYGGERSFVVDSTWTLVLPQAGPADQPPGAPPPAARNPFRRPG